MSRSNNEVHIYEINENITEKKSFMFIFCLFRIKQVCVMVMNE